VLARLEALRQPRAAAVLVALLAIAPYAATLGHGFAYDDFSEVVGNELIRSPAGLAQIFASSAWKGAGEENPIYRPLTTFSYAANYAAGALSPFGYHLANVLLHALASVLVLALGLELGLALGPSALAAVLFAVHPIHVEVVANVAGRKDSLATVFALSAVLAHRSALRRGGAWIAAAPLALAAAMFSKETGVTAAGLILAGDLLFGREDLRRWRSRTLGLYAVYVTEMGLYLAARWAAVGSLGVPTIPFDDNPIAYAPAWVRIGTAIAVLGRGLALLVAPLALSPDYSYRVIEPVTRLSDPQLLPALAALLLGLALLVWGRVRRWRMGVFACVWYGITVLPGSNLLFPVGTIFGERLLYLPSVGFCLAAGDLLWKGLATRAAPVLRVVLLAAALGLFVKTVSYAAIWSDNLTLFSASSRMHPESARLHRMLGGQLMERGDFAQASMEFQKALRILAGGEPSALSRPLLELGVADEALGKLDEAQGIYAQVLSRDPGSADALWRLGVIRWRQNLRADAVGLWMRTIAVDPRHARAMSDLGIAYLEAGDDAAARSMWERATQADPRLARAWLELGDLYERHADLVRARRAWQEFLRYADDRYLKERVRVEGRLRAGAPGP
jgi:tetratricopeptide (TPR) repeat protein